MIPEPSKFHHEEVRLLDVVKIIHCIDTAQLHPNFLLKVMFLNLKFRIVRREEIQTY